MAVVVSPTTLKAARPVSAGRVVSPNTRPAENTSTATQSKPTPFLKWAGGKGQLLQEIRQRLPENFTTYFEPFLGGGAVFFGFQPMRAILSDSNPELIQTFLSVRDEPDALMSALDQHIDHRTEESYFYRIRDELDPATLGTADRAARTIFLNKTCFNGLYRVNARGKFNVPWGAYRNPKLYDRTNILAAAELLHDKIVLRADYQVVCAYARDDDFVYLDPPYHPISETSRFTGYTKDDFGLTQQEQLAKTFRELDTRGCKVMLSNSATESIRSLYSGFRTEKLKAIRAINSKPTGRGPIDELLIMNYD